MEGEKKSGKAQGGIARALKLSSDERKAIAKKAAQERWSGEILKATHGSPDRPLKIGDLEIPCYVLSNGMRVLSGRGMQSALALGQRHGAILKDFIGRNSLNDYINNDLAMALSAPVKFWRPGRGGKTASGYEATILADICDVVLAARKAGALSGKELDVAEQCEILVRGFARVGIIALVDEATGYQKDRAKNELAKILELFVAKELQPWVRTFSVEFYEQMFRLRGLKFPGNGVKRPQYFGHLTNDVIYRRLAPGVWKELKEQVEKDEKGRLKYKLHQRLTPDLGHPKLRDLLSSVITIMKLSNQWWDFKDKLDRIHPAYNETMMLPFDLEGDTGKGI
jgi:hypothetical protein